MKIKIGSILLLSLIITSCSGDNNNEYIEESGTIEATESVISSQVSGKVLSINKDEGSNVSEGDTLLIIDHELYEIQLLQANAGRDMAKAQYDLLVKGARSEDIKSSYEMLLQAEANYKLAESDKERMVNLFESNSITKRQLEETNTRYEVTKAQYNSAKENYSKIKNLARPEEIAQAKANYEKADAASKLIEKNIRDCFVTSPIKGTVVKSYIEKGETVSMLSSLAKITDLSIVELVIYVPENVLGKIKTGQKAEITTDSYAGKVYEGKVIFISPEAEFTPKNIQTKDERTKLVFAVKIEVPNPNNELKAGMPADAKVIF
ncbi:MAG: efflux RND transporter periplasmic adaptor subunit [Ignavibacteriaceae bacterium]|jgi:HlyD family secretion protein|nr:efflux RND transporter periplasmic adaptor subunit [Ignavibacteriaceae bacterium]